MGFIFFTFFVSFALPLPVGLICFGVESDYLLSLALLQCNNILVSILCSFVVFAIYAIFCAAFFLACHMLCAFTCCQHVAMAVMPCTPSRKCCVWWTFPGCCGRFLCSGKVGVFEVLANLESKSRRGSTSRGWHICRFARASLHTHTLPVNHQCWAALLQH